jgi:hypothetical protein
MKLAKFYNQKRSRLCEVKEKERTEKKEREKKMNWQNE